MKNSKTTFGLVITGVVLIFALVIMPCICGLALDEIKSLVEIVAIILGALILLFVYLRFHPNMDLQINTEWADTNKSVLLVKITIKNISKVKCEKDKVLIQFLEYSNDFKSQLSEWVPFKESHILSDEQPVTYSNPKLILLSTEFWYPGDCVKVELAYKCKRSRTYKIGLQVVANIQPLGQLSKFFRQGNWKRQEQWTTTKIIYID